jgi:hypothetical protein
MGTKIVTHLVISTQLPHHLFLVSQDPYGLNSYFVHLPFLAYKHMTKTYTYLRKDRHTGSWHQFSVTAIFNRTKHYIL